MNKLNLSLFKAYYQLTKPGIIYGNLVNASAGFLLASTHHIDIWLLLATLAGTSLIIACGCVLNNYIDRGIDVYMARTKQRALVKGSIPVPAAMIYASVLGTLGFWVLIAYTNWLTVLAGATGLFFYVVLYSFFKRRSVHGTLVGSVSGAMPPVAGYLAVTNHIDSAAVIIFLILVFWQMAHFYSIAIYRFDDYKAAGLPVLPVKKGVKAAKTQILLYIVAFTVTATLFTIFGYTHIIFLLVTVALGLSWMYKGFKGFSTQDNKKWARGMFFYSLIVTLVLSIMLAFGSRLA